MDIREALKKKAVVFEHGRDARLLQHNLGNPNAVGVAGFAPREIAAMMVVPMQKHPAKGPDRDAFGNRFSSNSLFHQRAELYGRRHPASTLPLSGHLSNLKRLPWSEYICQAATRIV